MSDIEQGLHNMSFVEKPEVCAYYYARWRLLDVLWYL